MKIETAKILSEFIEQIIDTVEFEKWLYTNEDLEIELGEELYLHLISINFKDLSARIEVEKLLECKIDYGQLHTSALINLLHQFESRQVDLIGGLYKLYEWATLGYVFLGKIDVIGNLGEQGKSIVHLVDSSMSEEMKWQKLNEIDSNFLSELRGIRYKLQNGLIKLNGQKQILPFIGQQYEYEEV